MVRYTQIANKAIWMKLIVFNDSLKSFSKKIHEIKIPTPKFNAHVIAVVIIIRRRELSTKFVKTRLRIKGYNIFNNNQIEFITSVFIAGFSHFLYTKDRCVITNPIANKILGITIFSIRSLKITKTSLCFLSFIFVGFFLYFVYRDCCEILILRIVKMASN
ncbi:MAG: hypothetical protein RBG13Loki_0636 [Promethearchaeota archaeon CR_4]|nr:MAG: hypothetical protein RBG13Loki_0636 [Candidatus Lokiarchaeota archaeon CR_4]